MLEHWQVQRALPGKIWALRVGRLQDQDNDVMMRDSRGSSPNPFTRVRTIGVTLAGVETTTKHDGSPILKVAGRFMAGLATHESAERNTLVVRVDDELRGILLAEAPDTYYLTEHYAPHSVVLARLSRLTGEALRDLLSMSRRITVARDPARAHRAALVGRSRPRPGRTS
jgi:hypothetical protein